VQWVLKGRSVHHRIAGAAMPTGVAATAVTEASDVADEDLIPAERKPIWAAGWWARHPPAVRGLDKVTQHGLKRRSAATRGDLGWADRTMDLTPNGGIRFLARPEGGDRLLDKVGLICDGALSQHLRRRGALMRGAPSWSKLWVSGRCRRSG
jgi:hypothetical protein